MNYTSEETHNKAAQTSGNPADGEAAVCLRQLTGDDCQSKYQSVNHVVGLVWVDGQLRVVDL